MYMSVCMSYVYTCVQMLIHAEVRSQHRVFSSISFYLVIWDRVTETWSSPVQLEWVTRDLILACLGLRLQGLPSLLAQCWDYRCPILACLGLRLQGPCRCLLSSGWQVHVSKTCYRCWGSKIASLFFKIAFSGTGWQQNEPTSSLSLPGRTTNDPTSAQFVAGLFRLRVCFLV